MPQAVPRDGQREKSQEFADEIYIICFLDSARRRSNLLSIGFLSVDAL
jgi:hypothetical protein